MLHGRRGFRNVAASGRGLFDHLAAAFAAAAVVAATAVVTTAAVMAATAVVTATAVMAAATVVTTTAAVTGGDRLAAVAMAPMAEKLAGRRGVRHRHGQDRDKQRDAQCDNSIHGVSSKKTVATSEGVKTSVPS